MCLRDATATGYAGTIDIERALRDGVKAFEPGLLARANRGILYVDEVNLLEDNLVDVVLDSAAGGVNTVEREGVSIIHPAKFIMIGSGACCAWSGLQFGSVVIMYDTHGVHACGFVHAKGEHGVCPGLHQAGVAGTVSASSSCSCERVAMLWCHPEVSSAAGKWFLGVRRRKRQICVSVAACPFPRTWQRSMSVLGSIPKAQPTVGGVQATPRRARCGRSCLTASGSQSMLAPS